MLRLRTGRARTARKLSVAAATAAMAFMPLAAFAQATGGDFSDAVGKPFPLWFFLLGVGGVAALLAAYAAKSAVERGR